MLALLSALSLLNLVLCTNTSVFTPETLLRIAGALHNHSWKLPPAAVEWDGSTNSSFCSWHGGLVLLNVSFNPSLRGEVLTSIGLPSNLSILDTRGTQLSISNEDGKRLASGLYADMESEAYTVIIHGKGLCAIGSSASTQEPLFSQTETGSQGMHVTVSSAVTRENHSQVTASEPPNSQLSISPFWLCCFLHMFLNFAKGKYAPGDLPPRVAEMVTGSASPYITMVYTDVEGSTRLWEWDSGAMGSAIYMHDALMRKLLRRYSGYEVATEGDAFIVAFHTVADAMQWAMHAQIALMDLLWPDEFYDDQVLNCAEIVTHGDTVIFSGLRVRMAIESGPPTSTSANEMTGRLRIEGPFLPILELLADTGDGGQCIIGQECMKLLRRKDKKFASVPQTAPLLLQYLSRYKDVSAAEWETGQVRILTAQAEARKRTLQGGGSTTGEHTRTWLMRLFPGNWFKKTTGGEKSGVQSSAFQEFMLSLYYMITPGISRRRRSGSFHTSSTTFLSQDTVAERTFTAIHGVPRIMHMGDYWITLHSVSNNLPISVYQAFPAPLLARAFHVQRTLSGLGPISSPPFLCHPIVTADLLGVPKVLFDHPSEWYPKWTEAASVFVSWTEQSHMHGPLGEAVSRATSVCMLLCASYYGGYLSEGTSTGKRLLLFGKATDAVNFSINLQRALLEINWDDFEGRVTALWRAPRMPPAPCLRIAIDYSSVDSVMMSPASGRIFTPGPQLNRVIAMAHAAAPGECMITHAAVEAWQGELKDNSLDGGSPFKNLLPSTHNKPSDEFHLFTALMTTVHSNSGLSSGATDPSINVDVWPEPHEMQTEQDAEGGQALIWESGQRLSHRDAVEAAHARTYNQALNSVHPFTRGFLQDWLDGAVPGGGHESDSDCGHLNCSLAVTAAHEGSSRTRHVHSHDGKVHKRSSTGLTTSAGTIQLARNSAARQSQDKGLTETKVRKTSFAMPHQSGDDDGCAGKVLLLNNTARNPQSHSTSHAATVTDCKQSGTMLSWADGANRPVTGPSILLAASTHASPPSCMVNSAVRGPKQNSPIGKTVHEALGERTSHSFKDWSPGYRSLSKLRERAPHLASVRNSSYRREQFQTTLESLEDSQNSCCTSGASVEPSSHPDRCHMGCTSKHQASEQKYWLSSTQQMQGFQEAPSPLMFSTPKSGEKNIMSARAVIEGLEEPGAHDRWGPHAHEQSKGGARAKSSLSIDVRSDDQDLEQVDSPGDFYVKWNTNHARSLRRISGVSSKAWSRGQAEPHPFATMTWEERRRGHPSQQPHPLGAMFNPLKKHSRRSNKRRKRHMLACCAGYYRNSKPGSEVFTGAFEQTSKVLDGWGTKPLPDPPASLRRAVNPQEGTGEDGNGAPWATKHTPPLGLPKYPAFLDKQYSFLFKEKHISRGMLALFCGATFRVHGVADPFATYTIAAGNLLPLRQLVHAAPDIATYPVQIVRSATRELHACVYMPPADLGPITKAVQSILDIATKSKMGDDGFGGLNEAEITLQQFWGRGSDPGPIEKRVRCTV